MKKKIDSIDVALYFLENIDRFNGAYLTVGRLYRFLYYAQAWYLVNFDKLLFEDDLVVHRYGPYIMLIDSAYAGLKNNEKIDDRNSFCNKKLLGRKRIEFLDEFIDVFGKFSGFSLQYMLDHERLWIDVKKQGEGTIISLEDMKKFYTKLYEEQCGDKNG